MRQRIQLANVDLADQRGDVLIVLVARLRLGHRDLAQPRRHHPHHRKARDVAAELVPPLSAPGADQPAQAAARDALIVLHPVAHTSAAPRVGKEWYSTYRSRVSSPRY